MNPNVVVAIIFAMMFLGALTNKWSLKRMKLDVMRNVEPSQRPNMKWWNLGRQFQVLRSYRTISPRGRLDQIYVASAGAVVVPLIASIAWNIIRAQVR